MADIFLSYARQDIDRVRPLVEALQARGWSVFWDNRIPAGSNWEDHIERHLVEARCVVVVWTPVSVKSKWVRIEAGEAEDNGKLVPVYFDAVRAPTARLRSVQGATLTRWGGEQDSEVFRQFIEDVQRFAGPPSGSKTEPTPQKVSEDEPLAAHVFRDTLKDGGEGPEMVVIPAGSFRMGSPKSEKGHTDAEEPVHTVTFPEAFAMGRYPITFDEYDKFAKASGSGRPEDEGWGRGNRPVINVHWGEGVAYTEWLSEQTGKPYRLPTEAEWEYACRAGTTTARGWGIEVGKNRANFEGSGSKWSDKQTSPVDAFEPNPFGLHDMLGNVWELTQDCWHGNYEDAPKEGSAWLGADGGDCARRVIRGGTWVGSSELARAAYRDYDLPGRHLVGFRVVCAPLISDH